MTADAIPWRWRLSGLLKKVPEFRGRDRLDRLLRGDAAPPAGVHEGTFGPDLKFRACFREDGSLVDLFFLQYEEPSLAPLLRAVLQPGGGFFDVGANIGIYSLWAARLVGEGGRVHAFEPAERPRRYLESFLALNGIANVRVSPLAVGSRTGELTLYERPRASGLTSAIPSRGGTATEVTKVPMTTLDEYASEHAGRPPDLVKIDVEGLEMEVLRGAKELLAGPRPPLVVFESMAEHLRASGCEWVEVVRWMEREAGMELFALTPAGLAPVRADAREPSSPNTLAADPDRHAAPLRRLAGVRFRRNQTV